MTKKQLFAIALIGMIPVRASSTTWYEKLAIGAGIGAGITGICIAGEKICESVSDSWNASYVSDVVARSSKIRANYSTAAIEFERSHGLLYVARKLSSNYVGIGHFIDNFDRNIRAFRSAITSLRDKKSEWAHMRGYEDLYREAKEALKDAEPVYDQFHEVSHYLSENRDFFVLYGLLKEPLPQLNTYKSYPYHDLLDRLTEEHNTLVSTIAKVSRPMCQHTQDEMDVVRVLEKAYMLEREIERMRTRIIESFPYYEEKREKVLERHHREMMEAQRRLEEAERARAEAEKASYRLAIAQLERELKDSNEEFILKKNSVRPGEDSCNFKINFNFGL